MRIPPRLEPLLHLGVIDDVVRPLMSGKEADVFLVEAEGERRVAKVYKEATQRSFKHRADYTEGRRTRNTRTQRAMEKRSRFGKEQMEAAWQSAEVDVIYRLTDAGVRVPHPYDFVDGVLVMELIADERGEPAPRLVDVSFTPEEAEAIFQTLLRDIIRMLLAGVVHGDLSDFNVLIDAQGPVIIDFPQATDPAFNRNAEKLFLRDVDNVTQFLGRHARGLRKKRYGPEIWALYEASELTEDARLTGKPPKHTGQVDMSPLLAEMMELEREAEARRAKAGIVQKAKFRPKPTEVPLPPPAPPEGGKKKRRRRKKKGGRGDGPPQAPPSPPAPPEVSLDDLGDLDDLLLVEEDPHGG